MKLEEGNWVTHPSFVFPAVIEVITPIEVSIHNIIDGWLHIDCDFNSLKLWEPKEGERCWFWNEGYESEPTLARLKYKGAKQCSTIGGQGYFTFCKPFLPNYSKEKE